MYSAVHLIDLGSTESYLEVNSQVTLIEKRLYISFVASVEKVWEEVVRIITHLPCALLVMII